MKSEGAAAMVLSWYGDGTALNPTWHAGKGHLAQCGSPQS